MQHFENGTVRSYLVRCKLYFSNGTLAAIFIVLSYPMYTQTTTLKYQLAMHCFLHHDTCTSMLHLQLELK